MGPSVRTEATLRLATCNLLHGLDVRAGGRLDLPATATAIRGLAADVIALQEVDRGLRRTGTVDQVAWLARALGMHGVFAPALLGDPGTSWTPANGHDSGGAAYGVGLLSRLPLDRVGIVPLPAGGPGRRRRPRASPGRPGWDREPRVALLADVITAAGALRLGTTHLSYLPWRGLRQLRQAVRATWESRGDGCGTVLLGDLNLPARAVRLAAPRWTHAGGGRTYPSWHPRLQVDHVLLRGPVALRGTAVTAATTSDHLGVIAVVMYGR